MFKMHLYILLMLLTNISDAELYSMLGILLWKSRIHFSPYAAEVCVYFCVNSWDLLFLLHQKSLHPRIWSKITLLTCLMRLLLLALVLHLRHKSVLYCCLNTCLFIVHTCRNLLKHLKPGKGNELLCFSYLIVWCSSH